VPVWPSSVCSGIFDGRYVALYVGVAALAAERRDSVVKTATQSMAATEKRRNTTPPEWPSLSVINRRAE
jgi:hypothetical protein